MNGLIQGVQGQREFYNLQMVKNGILNAQKKPAKDNLPEKYYRYEFWSEIIAHQLGILLGLNVLQYDIVINRGEIGCISPLIIDRDKEQLTEVGRYMTSLNSAFLPEDNTTKHEYTFQLLKQTIFTNDSFKIRLH